MAYLHGDGLCLNAVLGHFQSYDTGLGVERSRGVEDKVADAVVDGFVPEGLDGLQGVGMMADQSIGTCENQLMGLQTLAGYGL